MSTWSWLCTFSVIRGSRHETELSSFFYVSATLLDHISGQFSASLFHLLHDFLYCLWLHEFIVDSALFLNFLLGMTPEPGSCSTIPFCLYRHRLKGGPQVVWMLQARLGRSGNKIHQTWGPPFSWSLYTLSIDPQPPWTADAHTQGPYMNDVSKIFWDFRPNSPLSVQISFNPSSFSQKLATLSSSLYWRHLCMASHTEDVDMV